MGKKILFLCRIRIRTCKCQWRGWGQRSLRLQTSICSTWQWKWLRWGNWESRIWNNTIPFGILVGWKQDLRLLLLVRWHFVSYLSKCWKVEPWTHLIFPLRLTVDFLKLRNAWNEWWFRFEPLPDVFDAWTVGSSIWCKRYLWERSWRKGKIQTYPERLRQLLEYLEKMSYKWINLESSKILTPTEMEISYLSICDIALKNDQRPLIKLFGTQPKL